MKSTIIKCSLIIFISLFSSSICLGQNDYEKELQEDLVNIIDSKYNINDFMLVKIGEQQFQIKMSANAPTDILSRDNFISIYSTLGTMMMLSMFEEAGYSIANIDIEDLDELIGEADITFNFVMAKNGLQLQVKTDDGTKRLTMTWKEILGD